MCCVFTAKFVAGISRAMGIAGIPPFAVVCASHAPAGSWQEKGLKQFRYLKHEAYAGCASADPSDPWGWL